MIYEKNIIKNNSILNVYKKIKNHFDWLIYVDVDEFITTKKNISNTIREELETTFKNAACVKIPWVMMSCNSIKKNPRCLLKTNIYRWNHDNKHENKLSSEKKFRCRYDKIETKCIFKPKFFDNIKDHCPFEPLEKNIQIVDGIYNNEAKNSMCTNLREKDIANGFLLCYHYRIISVEQCIKKINDNIWYKNYTLQDLMSTDCPEVIDETLKNKSI